MTKEQTIKVLQMLNAFYAGGGNDPREQVIAWHMILDEIRKVHKSRDDKVEEIIIGISYGRSYDMISDQAKTLISEDKYNEWLKIDAEEFAIKSGTYRQVLKQKQKRLAE